MASTKIEFGVRIAQKDQIIDSEATRVLFSSSLRTETPSSEKKLIISAESRSPMTSTR